MQSPTMARFMATRSAAVTQAAHALIADLGRVGVDLADVADLLERQGVESFDKELGGTDRFGD